jgi:RNA polymerase sigma-70 factor (ECF subfamily)
MTKNAAHAEDIMQDVFLTVVEKAQTYKKDISAKAWLLKITRNKTLNLIKSESRLAPLSEIHTDRAFDAIWSDIEFFDALKCLTAIGKQVVLFHFAYGLSHKETAKILKMSHSAVRKQYERAINVLKTEIKEV